MTMFAKKNSAGAAVSHSCNLYSIALSQHCGTQTSLSRTKNKQVSRPHIVAQRLNFRTND